MLQFYYHPLSPLARRVWIALLEKKLPFESILVNLKEGEQLQPEFLQLNPFHHVPVILDDGLRVIESIAILDYLETKYPQISLLPTDPATLARVRMVQMVTCNELGSQILPLIVESEKSLKLVKAKRCLKRVISFMAKLLGENLYFGGEQFTIGDIVAGNAVILAHKLGFEVGSFANIAAWRQRLEAREVWQKTQPNQEQLEIFQATVKNLVKHKRNSRN